MAENQIPVIEVTYYVASSLDGFIADPRGGVEWLEPFERGDEDYGYASFYARVDAVVMGRATFDFARTQERWPYADRPAWVFSREPLVPQLPDGTHATSDSPTDVVDALASRGFGHVYLVGGGRLAASFREAGLITRYVVSVVPVILGSGLPMLAEARCADRLRLVGSRAYDGGIVQMEYRVER